MATFNWVPVSASKTQTPRVRSAQFGDGYSQRTADGINNKPREWQLTFTQRKTYIDAINTFLDTRSGVESFDWTDPEGHTAKYVCASWNRSLNGTDVVSTLAATFTEVFGE
jgi:phage-related protein